MKNNASDISDFGDRPLNPSLPFDFSKAVKLDRSGTTCDTFEAYYHRRHVFVKKLKDEFVYNPVYRVAFSKEYETGCRLNHKSLPDYTEFFDTYFIMNYIEGPTLDMMIRQNDSWLKDTNHISQLLMQLVDVVDYLHQNNIIHCDIKPDNIIITTGTRNLVLIDLDKCYTDWHNDTSGSPVKYDAGNDTTGSPVIDFHGIGLLIDKLAKGIDDFPTRKFKRFRKECFRPVVTPDSLRNSLRPRLEISRVLTIITAAFALTAVLSLIFRPANNEITETSPVNTSTADSVVLIQETSDATNILNQDTPAEKNYNGIFLIDENDIQSKINSELSDFFPPLRSELKNLEQLAQTDSVSSTSLLNAISDFAQTESAVQSEIYNHFANLFPSIELTDIMKNVWNSPVWKDYMHESDSIQSFVGTEIKRKSAAGKSSVWNDFD